MTATTVRLPRGRIIAMLNRFRRLPEPAKRRLRIGFVWVVDLGGRLPGVPGAATRARRVIPGPYQWFSDRYEIYREAHNRDEPGRPLLIVDAGQAEGLNGFWVNPPDDLTTDERACFTRLAAAANARRKRILW
jgi:hypothetical protein